MSLKKSVGKEDNSLTAILMVDTYDQRFFPFTKTIGPWCLQRICNIPLIYYTLSWIRRTEIKRVILVASKKNDEFSEVVERASNLCFETLHVVICKNAMSVGDALRELDSRNFLTGDFLLVSNPATFVSSTLQKQIDAFREQRRANKNNVMTLICSELENSGNSIIGIQKNTNKLILFHRQDDSSQLEIDKNHFISDVVIRRDIIDSGIALCSLNIAAQFSDNFDFQNRDDVIREILVNEEILMQNIHVSVLPENEAAMSITDYESLLLVSNLLMERWLYPLVPDRVGRVFDDCCAFTAGIGNIYVANKEYNFGKLLRTTNIPANAFNVSIGNNCTIASSAKISCCSIGNDTKIGANTLLFNTIIGNNCVIGDYCTIQEAVIGNGVTIPARTKLPKRTVISAEVTYPANLEFFANSAVCAWGPGEDFEDTINDKSIFGVHIWSLTNGTSFWNVDGPREKILSKESQEYEDESGCEFESDGSEPYEMDNTVQFYEEVVESMERIQTLAFSNQQMHNLILEINSSKLAYNICMEDVAKNVFSAFLGLPGNEVLSGFKALASKWRMLFTNYYQPKKSQIQLLLAIEERFKNNSDEFGPKMAKMIHMLYDDLDILEEEAILEWADSLENEVLHKYVKPIVDWLRQDSDEDESDS